MVNYLKVDAGTRIRFKKEHSSYGYKIGTIATILGCTQNSSNLREKYYAIIGDNNVRSNNWPIPDDWFEIVEDPITPEEEARALRMKSHQDLADFLGM